MAKSNGRSPFGRRSGTVTVIEEHVHRSAARNAKATFWVTWITVTLLAATVAASKWHPIIALFTGMALGLVVAVPAAGLVIAWPVIRVIWWWAPEVGAALGLVAGWVQLADHTTLVPRLIIVGLVAGVPSAIGPVRRCIIAVAWCQIARHRIRTCFSQFIITNRTGSLPLILWARPTLVGVRMWIWLRPGLAIGDLEQRLDKIAVASWAASITVEKASESNSAFVRLDIKRRDAYPQIVGSPLLSMVTADTPAAVRDAVPVPSALDLPDVTADQVTAPPRAASSARADRKTPAPAAAASTPAATDNDLHDWI